MHLLYLSHLGRLLQQPSRQSEAFERLLGNRIEGFFSIQSIAHHAITGPEAQVYAGWRPPIE
ncbi:hypothetical protein D3C76_909420 [compost metagenome]